MDKIQIGLNAGAIWNTMDANHDKHVWDVEELQQATGLSVPDFYAALGWLARGIPVRYPDFVDVPRGRHAVRYRRSRYPV